MNGAYNLRKERGKKKEKTNYAVALSTFHLALKRVVSLFFKVFIMPFFAN